MTRLPKLIYRFTVPVRIPADLFVETDYLIFKFIWNWKGSKEPKQSGETKIKQESLRFLISKLTAKQLQSGHTDKEIQQ